MANPPGAEAIDQEEEGYVREGGITIDNIYIPPLSCITICDIYIPPPPDPACTLVIITTFMECILRLNSINIPSSWGQYSPRYTQ